MREPITIQKPVTTLTRDLFGQANQGAANQWETHCAPFAEIKSRAVTGTNTASGVQAVQVSYTVKLQYCAAHAAVTAEMRVRRQDGLVLAIVGPARDPDGQRKEIWLDCVAGSI